MFVFAKICPAWDQLGSLTTFSIGEYYLEQENSEFKEYRSYFFEDAQNEIFDRQLDHDRYPSLITRPTSLPVDSSPRFVIDLA